MGRKKWREIKFKKELGMPYTPSSSINSGPYHTCLWTEIKHNVKKKQPEMIFCNNRAIKGGTFCRKHTINLTLTKPSK